MELPVAWRNVSGLNLLSDEELLVLGWLPAIENYPALAPYESYGSPVVAIEATQVVFTYPVVPADLAEVKAGQIAGFEDEFQFKLFEDYGVEDYIIMLVGGTMTNTQKKYIDDLDKALKKVVNDVTGAATVAAALAVVPVWPAKP
jgi:hypothetical protein